MVAVGISGKVGEVGEGEILEEMCTKYVAAVGLYDKYLAESKRLYSYCSCLASNHSPDGRHIDPLEAPLSAFGARLYRETRDYGMDQGAMWTPASNVDLSSRSRHAEAPCCICRRPYT